MSKGYVIEYNDKKVVAPEYLLLKAITAFNSAGIVIQSVILSDIESNNDMPMLDENTFGYWVGYPDDSGKEGKIFVPETKLETIFNTMRELELNPKILTWTNQIIE